MRQKIPFFMKTLLKRDTMRYLFPSIGLSLCLACLEGGCYAFFVGALTVLSGTVPPFLSKAPCIASWPFERLFIFFLFGAVALQLVKGGIALVSEYLLSQLSANMQKAYHLALHTQLLRFSFPFAQRYKLGELIEYVRNPATYVTQCITALNHIVVNGAIVLICLAMMFSLSPLLSMITCCVIAAFALVHRLFLHRMADKSREYNAALHTFSKQLAQLFSGLRTLHVYDMKRECRKHMNEAATALVKKSVILSLWNKIGLVKTELFGIFIVGMTLFIGSSVFDSSCSLPILCGFIGIAYRMAVKMHHGFENISIVVYYSGQILHAEHFLSNEDKCFVNNDEGRSIRFAQRIDLADVTLTHAEGDKPTLDRVSVTIRQGESVAFVGKSGAGKSSLLDVVVGLYAPSQGEVLVDGYSLSTIALSEYRKSIGYVSQDTFMFNDTIAYNIHLGKPGYSRDDVRRAARLANADGFIERLPNGYESIVGEWGHTLSAGQRQRVALARALILDPALLIFDEVTSNLDADSEAEVLTAIEALRKTKTIIFAAHKLPTAQSADRVYVLEEGRIVEEGTHADLLSKRGPYHLLWRLQQLPQPTTV